MERLRGTWLALLGATLLVVLSVSAALGADPVNGEKNRGQAISSFVHELIFGPSDDEQTEEEADESEEESEESEEQTDGEAASSHGACVSEVARDPEAIGGPNENHGGAVSEAARETCWETDESEEESEESEEQTDGEAASSHGACVSEVARDPEAIGGPNENHGGAVSEAARETCWETDEAESTAVIEAGTERLSAKEQRKAEREAAKAERRAAREAAKAERAAPRAAAKAARDR